MNLEAICIEAAGVGARVLRERFDQPRTVNHKGRIDLVTDADRASEDAVLRRLRELAPGVAVLAEESGESGSGDTRFIVDPLDGTTNYAHGLPLFCCTVAAEVKGEVVAGATIDPVRGETFHAARGQGAWLAAGRRYAPARLSSERARGRARVGLAAKRISVSQASELLQALLCTGFPYGQGPALEEMLASFARFTGLSRGVRRLGSAALDLAYVAAGRLDGFWERGLHAWDVAAGKILVEEAGGIVSRFDGAPLDLAGGEIAASGPGLHAAILKTLREVTSPDSR